MIPALRMFQNRRFLPVEENRHQYSRLRPFEATDISETEKKEGIPSSLLLALSRHFIFLEINLKFRKKVCFLGFRIPILGRDIISLSEVLV